MAKQLTWLECAADLHAGDRVVFVEPFDIFDLALVPAGATGTVKDNGLNEIWQTLAILPDDDQLRVALSMWDGEIILNGPTADGIETPEHPESVWREASPIARAEGAGLVFRIRAEVWGGVTGSREGWLKNAAGAVAVFTDRAEAEAEAARHNEQMNASPFRTATFSYTVEEWHR